MKIKFFFIIIFYFYPFSSFATNIKVVDLQILIESNNSLTSFFSKIDNDQTNHLQNFKKEELNLQVKLSELDGLKLILDNEEMQNEINNYNSLFSNFNLRVEEFNLHYENQINNFKNIVLNKIIEILKTYSIENKIDLVLDSNNYILSSNAINITDIILVELNKNNIEIDLEKYK